MTLFRANKPDRSQPGALSVERMLQISFAVQVSLGGLLLGMGERSNLPSFLAIGAAGFSLYLTDMKGIVRLNRAVANLVGLTAVTVSISNFFRVSSEEQLLAVANLLIYLQVVLLFQQKYIRLYWQLLVLSVLEVVVGAALCQGMLFGLLLMVYMFAALTTMGLLFICHEALRCREIAPPIEPESAAADHPADRPAESKSRWPWAAESITVTPVYSDDPGRQILGGGILRQTVGIGVGTLIVAGVCFFFMPRLTRPSFGQSEQHAVIGYSPTVKLGDLGPMLQNPELVMRINFVDERSLSPITPAVPPLLRGSLVTRYYRGEWHPVATNYKPELQKLAAAPFDSPCLVRQQITIEPMDEPVLFCVYPPYDVNSSRSNRRIQYDASQQRVTRNHEDQTAEFTYELFTTGIREGRQAAIVPELSGLSRRTKRQLTELPDAPLRGRGSEPAVIDDRDKLTGLRALTAQKVSEAHLADSDAYGKAKLLERFLSTPPFEYTLDRPPPAEGVDPIEDFVTRNQRGHCEYFASALTLMLRSQNIPARMVIGYHGGDWNKLGAYLDVRQLHAHAWVEAYLEPDQIPAELLHGDPRPDLGAWLILDPTPSTLNSDVFAPGSLMSSLGDFADYMQLLWTTNVIGLNTDRQDQTIYKPLAQIWHVLTGLWQSPEHSLAATARAAWHWIIGVDQEGGRPAFTWRAVLAVLVLGALLLLAYRIVRWIIGIGWRLRRPRAMREHRLPPSVRFYHQLETLLARHGIVRQTGQTQREFARRAARQLAIAGKYPIAEVPQRIVDVFYRVRFGHATLDSTESQTVERLLLDLTEGLAAR